MNDHKTYVDKGVQTGSLLVKNPPTFSYPEAQCIHKGLDNSQSSEFCSSSHFLDHSGAYIDSGVSSPDHSRYISEHPAVYNQRASKYGDLGYGKPNHLALISDRTVSLPETSPPYRITQPSGRLVSMPESLEMLRYSHDHSQPQLGRSERSNVSLTSDGTEGEHAFLGGVPQTPSPPSSPESVVIIGNEDKVPQAFLRHKSTFDDTDHEGWTPCRGSPPKPIPALHGPLSLPYARCPSGAEGTVIEGEDLTHMIWGLDSNGPQLAQSKHQTSGQFYKPLLQPIPSSRSSNETPFVLRQDYIAQNLYNRDVIDLLRPEFQATSSHVGDMQLSRPVRTCLSPVEGIHLSRGDSTQNKDIQSKKANIYEFVRRDSPIQLYPTSFGLPPEAKSCNAGLGIDLWRNNLRSGTFDAAFVSRDTKESTLTRSQPLESIYPTHIYQTPRNLPVSDTRSFEHIGLRPGIPTPPDTTSPQWSPRFHQSHIASISPELHYNQSPSNHIVNTSQNSVPRSTRVTLVSSQQVQSQALFTKPGYRSVAPDPLDVVADTHRLPPPYRSPGKVDDVRSSYDSHIDDSNFSQDRPNITSPSLASHELRRGLTQHQPRSIPLARLIQRRLSSVVEEEVVESGSCNVHRPPASSLPNANQTSGCPSPDVSNSSRKDTKREQIPSRKTAVIISSAAGPSNDHTKRAYKPPGHPSRRAPTGTRDTSTKLQRSPKADQPVTVANRFGENKENTTATQKITLKSKIMRKKKHFKKQETSSCAPDG